MKIGMGAAIRMAYRVTRLRSKHGSCTWRMCTMR